jgi:hypothetical protein
MFQAKLKPEIKIILNRKLFLIQNFNATLPNNTFVDNQMLVTNEVLVNK